MLWMGGVEKKRGFCGREVSTGLSGMADSRMWRVGGRGRLGRVDLRERRGAEMEGILAAGRFDAETDGSRRLGLRTAGKGTGGDSLERGLREESLRGDLE